MGHSVSTHGIVISGLSQESYKAHPFHSYAETWTETNCYTDLWIEILHALRLDPCALLAFSFGTDFEGDQWTFLKPSLGDLWALYGLDVQELNVWDNLAQHICEQIGRGNLPLVEVDSFYLPDTHGTAYQTEHTKTTIGINAIDFERQHLGYFHNSGYFELNGDDFGNILRIKTNTNFDILPPYAEFVKLKSLFSLSHDKLHEISLRIAQQHLLRRPAVNPFTAFRTRFAHDVERLLTQPTSYYHKYAFASLRQMGTAFMLAATYVNWLDTEQSLGLGEASRAFSEISDSAKILLFKLARAVNRGKVFVDDTGFDTMEASWQKAFEILDARLGHTPSSCDCG